MLIRMRHSSRLQWRIDTRVQTHCFHRGPPSVRRPAALSCYSRPFKQVIARRAARQCSPLPYKQAGFWTRRPQRPGLHDLYIKRCMLNCPAPADECRMSASLDVTQPRQPLCKALIQPCHRHVAAFQPSLPSCSDRPTASWPAEHSTAGRRERQASSLCTVLYSLMFMPWYLPELHCYTAGMQDGCHFRHRVCRTRNLTTLMGNANTCVCI
jgi:hypothetical protein